MIFDVHHNALPHLQHTKAIIWGEAILGSINSVLQPHLHYSSSIRCIYNAAFADLGHKFYKDTMQCLTYSEARHFQCVAQIHNVLGWSK